MLWAQVLTGTELDASGEMQALEPREPGTTAAKSYNAGADLPSGEACPSAFTTGLASLTPTAPAPASGRTARVPDRQWGRRTIEDDGSRDLLTGRSGLDWFVFVQQEDMATDARAAMTVAVPRRGLAGVVHTAVRC